jgi:hypothetical protein
LSPRNTVWHARSGLVCVWITHPFRVSVDHQLRGGRVLQEEPEIQGAIKITQDVLHGGEVELHI